MMRDLACALLLFAGVVHASSNVCSLNHRCVYYELCQDGFINIDGSGLIDPRSPKPVPDSVPYPRCDKVGSVCCRHPDNPDGPDVVDDFCPFHHRCVAAPLCINGEINTSGIGLLDVRINQEINCRNPEYSSSPAVCCRKPHPAESCPVTHSCVPRGYCNGVTTDPKGTYVDCYLDASQTEVGVCCDPLGIWETCSSDGSVQCVESGQCNGQISTHDNGNYVECYLSQTSTGVCCSQPVATCPDKHSCINQASCKTTIWDNSGVSLPHSNDGSWQQCLIGGTGPDTGVCCSEPSPSEKCGIRHTGIDVRIKNSNLLEYQAEFAEFPWQAIIFFTNFTFKCGASLINNQWLLTAAHCVDGFQPYDFRVRLGEWEVDKYDELLPYLDVDVHSFKIHPDFNASNLHNDIAVLKLAEPVQYKYHINTICLPNYSTLTPGTRCIATGWGKDAFNDGAFQTKLKKVDLPFVEHEYCQTLLRNTRLGEFFKLDRSFLCAGGELDKDACTGDGGGPLVCQSPDGSYFLAGITAWGIGCGLKDVPGVYVDVKYFSDWVNANTI